MSCHLTMQKHSEWVWCRAGRGLGSRCFRRVSEPSGTSHSPKTPTQLLPAEAGSQHQAFLDGPWQMDNTTEPHSMTCRVPTRLDNSDFPVVDKDQALHPHYGCKYQTMAQCISDLVTLFGRSTTFEINQESGDRQPEKTAGRNGQTPRGTICSGSAVCDPAFPVSRPKFASRFFESPRFDPPLVLPSRSILQLSRLTDWE